MRLTQEQVNEICAQHEAWLKDCTTGKRANFSGASLRGLSLKGRNLTGAFLKSADFSHTNLEGANFTNAKAAFAKFEDCTADHAIFDGAWLTAACFEGASLQRASFRKAEINFASFAEAELWRADFVDAVTGGVSFAGANMEFAAFNSGIAGDSYDDKQIAEFAYHLCSAVLGSRTNSSEVKETIRKILSLANRANSVKVFGPVQENIRGKYFTAKRSNQ